MSISLDFRFLDDCMGRILKKILKDAEKKLTKMKSSL